MWYSRLSLGWDIQTLLLTLSSIQYSIGEKSPFFIITHLLQKFALLNVLQADFCDDIALFMMH